MYSVKNYVYTERAHLMCPNMHFGIMAKIESNYDEGKLRQSIDALQKAHPFLQCLIAEETDAGKVCMILQPISVIRQNVTDKEQWEIILLTVRPDGGYGNRRGRVLNKNEKVSDNFDGVYFDFGICVAGLDSGGSTEARAEHRGQDNYRGRKFYS